MWTMFMVICIVGAPCAQVMVNTKFKTEAECDKNKVAAVQLGHLALDYTMDKNNIDHDTPHRIGVKCVKVETEERIEPSDA